MIANAWPSKRHVDHCAAHIPVGKESFPLPGAPASAVESFVACHAAADPQGDGGLLAVPCSVGTDQFADPSPAVEIGPYVVVGPSAAVAGPSAEPRAVETDQFAAPCAAAVIGPSAPCPEETVP
jgi:hypothetical protein